MRRTEYAPPAQSAPQGKWAYAAIALAVSIAAAQIGVGIGKGEGLSWDFANYYDAGRKVAAGELAALYDPDAIIAGQAPQGRMAYLAPPLSAILFVPLAWFPPQEALVVFKVENAVASVLALALLFWCYRRMGAASFGSSRAFAAVFCLAAAAYQPFWEVYHVGGQATPTSFLALVVGLCCYVRGRDLIAAVFLVIAVTIKPGFVVALVMLAVLTGPRFMAYTTAAGLALAAVSILWAGWPLHAAFLERLADRGPKVWPFNSSLTVAFDNLRAMPDPPIAPATASRLALGIRIAATALLVAALAVQRSNIPSRIARRHFDIVIAIASGLLFMPVVWEHYLALLFIPLTYCLVACPRLPRPAQSLLAVVLILSMTQTVQFTGWLGSVVYLNTVPELVVIGLFKSLPLALTASLLIAYRRELAVALPEQEPATLSG